jgi:hypothetical protein
VKHRHKKKVLLRKKHLFSCGLILLSSFKHIEVFAGVFTRLYHFFMTLLMANYAFMAAFHTFFGSVGNTHIQTRIHGRIAPTDVGKKT